jgi:fused signal recognition particle receptor
VGRSWRNFFRRGKERTEDSTTEVVDTPVESLVDEEPLDEEESSPNGYTLDESTTAVQEPPVEQTEVVEDEEFVDEASVEELDEVPAVEERVLDEEVTAEAPPEPVEEEPVPTGSSVLEEAEEEEASGGWLRRLRSGMRRSRESFVGQLNAAVAEFQDAGDEEFWERVEEILITSDVGVPTTAKLVAGLEQEALEKNITSGKQLRALMIEHATRLLDKPIDLDISHHPSVLLMVGVNGTGKTTNIGKLVHFLPGKKMLAAGDTFRAAAIEQLQRWGERTGAEVIARERGADAAAVAHDALDAAIAEDVDVLLIDTAGRLHTKVNLMAELEKVKRVIGRRLPGAPHEVLLTVDATTGQNGLRQAKMFSETAGVTGIILTKLDGTAKGGIALAIADEVGVPIKLISVGEQVGDLHPFEAREFAEALFGDL